MARRCVRYKRTSGGRRCAKYAGTKRRTYRGYGQSVKVYSGFGALGVGMDAILPPAVGGGTAVGTSLLLRAFVDPEVKGNGSVETDPDTGLPKVHWAFKYAGLLGAAAGIGTSVILGFFQGWGSAVAGGITALSTGLGAQFYNSVVPEEANEVKRREKYAWRGYGKPYGLVAMQPRGGGQTQLMQPGGRMAGRGFGMIGASPSQARNFLVAGRGVQSMPNEVLKQVNAAAWGGSAPVM